MNFWEHHIWRVSSSPFQRKILNLPFSHFQNSVQYVAAPHTTTPRTLFFVSPFPQQLHFLKYCQRTALERDRRRSNEALDTYNISSTIEKKHKEWPSISQNSEWAIFDFVRYGSDARICFRRRDVFKKRYNLFKYRRSSMTNHTDLTFMIILTSLNDIFLNIIVYNEN